MLQPEAHHRIPQVQDISDKCAAVGLDIHQAIIDNIQIGRWVEGAPHGPHQSWKGQHLQGWRAWFDTVGNNYTKQDILNQVASLDDPVLYPPMGPWP